MAVLLLKTVCDCFCRQMASFLRPTECRLMLVRVAVLPHTARCERGRTESFVRLPALMAVHTCTALGVHSKIVVLLRVQKAALLPAALRDLLRVWEAAHLRAKALDPWRSQSAAHLPLRSCSRVVVCRTTSSPCVSRRHSVPMEGASADGWNTRHLILASSPLLWGVALYRLSLMTRRRVSPSVLRCRNIDRPVSPSNTGSC
mmetsp:Transcript_24181/g.61612  ORF Transcript_24181/g.61612 Transcript_24181/m.61612 type:complete len:202 (-) Transcript_24181:110-715(-)